MKKILILSLLIFGLVAVAGCKPSTGGNSIFLNNNNPSNEAASGNSNQTANANLDNANAATNPNSPVSTFVMPGTTTAIPISEITDTRYLELVNHEYGMNSEPDRNLIVDAWPAVPVSTRDITLHISARTAVSELFDAARSDNSIGTFFVSSGYRDVSTQEQLYNGGMDRALVLPPGHSEHHTGLGIDILALEIGQFELANTPEGRWLANHSWKYGLILRYPENKQDFMGIAYEPWHFRYVGQPHAFYMWENDMVLEEYIEFLRETRGYTIAYNGLEFTVLYQEPTDGMLNIPANCSFTVSNDNLGGFIITTPLY